jgi:outer membrane receptor protein involved in Fe transport
MRLLIGCFFSAFLACLFFASNAQVLPAVLEGKIKAENGSPADAATVVLLKSQDSSIVTSAVADGKGAFHFAGLPAGGYILLISKAGYQKIYAGPYSVKTGQAFTAQITLKQLVQNLNEVSVTSTRPDIEAQPGKLIINVQNNLLAQGNSAYDILRQSPGVRVDNSNNISVIGRQNALILINGKPTNLSGEDLAGMLRGMQANTIDRIELITGGSAKYDASGGGIVNIILKKGQNTGFNGTFTAAAGYGKYYTGNTGIVFNDRTDKFNIFGHYNYSADKTFHDFTNDRIINFDNITSGYNTNYNSVQKHNVNAFGIGMDYYLSRTQTIGFLVNGFITDVSIAKNNPLEIYNQSVLDSTIVANSDVSRHTSQINYNLNYNDKLDKAGKTLSADVNYTTYNRSSAEYITDNFFDASGNTYRDPLQLQNLSPSNIKIWYAEAAFTDPLSKTSKLEAGLKYSNVTSNNDLIFGPLVNGVYQSDPNFTNHFIYTENVNAAYLNYENRFNKFNLTAALRAEQTIAKGNSATSGQVVNNNYTDLFPNVLLTYSYDDKNDFSLGYNRGIRRPEYEQLNPFLYYVDPYDYTAGNPNLKPQYTNSIELSYHYAKTFLITLYSSIVGNAYEFPFYEQNDVSRVNINTNVNLGTVYNYGVRFFAPVVFTNWWNADFSVDAAYERYVSYPVNGSLDKGAQDITLTNNQYFIISPTILVEIYGWYESPNFYGVNQFKAEYHVDAGISKRLFNKRGSLKLSATDIFNTWHDRSYTNYQNLNMTGTDKIETQVVKLTFTYRFGKTSVKSSPHLTGNEEEQNRIKD